VGAMGARLQGRREPRYRWYGRATSPNFAEPS
jgi:hypothetical protein